MHDLLFLIPALPLAGFALLVFAGRRLGEPLAGWLATAAVGASFLVTVAVFAEMVGNPAEERALTQALFEWLPVGGFQVDVGLLADQLSVTMLLFVTGIATLIHLYAIGYMHGDPRFSKFFVYLNLFVFSMIMLVLGDNLLITFLGWEGVGACSYFLISFWHESEANASAGKKAFVTNRIGDFGFMVAIFFTFESLGTLNYAGIVSASPSLATTTATVIAAMLFLGAVGKSAQLPLYVWLPDAMAGPTPVSALIHAATMVTAGVYLLTRMNPVIALASDWIPWLIAIVGAGTALFAATVAVAQNDIKKVLAYSTVSQLGYMFLAVGSGAYVAAIFHMVTHAFFKALMFLGSGSVIHGMGDEQDMRRMGALRKVMPITAVTFIVGWLAIAGVFPFSGFWSKDEILLYAWQKSPALWVVGWVTAVLTAFYMSRQVFLVFFGKERWSTDPAGEAEQSAREVADDDTGGTTVGTSAAASGTTATATATEPSGGAVALDHGDEHATAHDGGHHDVHPHESPWLMTLPLVVLAVLAAVGGGLNLPFTDDTKILEHWLEPVVEFGEAHLDQSAGVKWGLALAASVGALLGIAAAAAVYLRNRRDLARRAEQPVLARGWYYDSGITSFMGGPGRKGFDAIAWFDRTIVDGAVNGIGQVVRSGSGSGRRLQTGYVRNYALGVALGAVVVAALLVSKAVY
ncbi:MAG TPA: NADH-quinone oxidoreductase subunit L [Aquihabitans sp.]|jgi:NADH-quinone oxidoreductase subunit L|nr:NADH-quinone oxidoreductase subunit L [Aquihabitans sp.]